MVTLRGRHCCFFRVREERIGRQVICPKTPGLEVAEPGFESRQSHSGATLSPCMWGLAACPPPGGVKVSTLTGPNPTGARVGGHDVAADAYPPTDATDPVAPPAAGLAPAATSTHAPAGESGPREAGKWGRGEVGTGLPSPTLFTTNITEWQKPERLLRPDTSAFLWGSWGRSEVRPLP